MRMSALHPIVAFVYFAAVIGFAMFIMHPIALGISFVCSAVFALQLTGVEAIKTGLKFVLPMMIFAAALNPLFNHGGVTILTYLPNGNPLTLEAALFGVAAAFMLASVITWFSCFNSVICSEKFVYLFGRFSPALALILSMSLRFVSRFRTQIRQISDAQKGIGRDISQGNFFLRVQNGVKILSIATTWALESSVDTADSMNARGYGLPGRTAFSLFRFARRDFLALAYIAACASVVIFGAVTGATHFRFFPSIRGAGSIFVFVAYFLLCAFPIFVNLKEDFKWCRIKSKI